METTVLNKTVSPCSTPENSDQKSSSSSSGKQPMSATLRERLKKSRRTFDATFTVAKRLKIDEGNNCNAYKEGSSPKEESYFTSQGNDEYLEKVPDGASLIRTTPERELHISQCSGSSKTTQNFMEVLSLGKDCGQEELLEEKMTLVKQVQEKEELLRRLKLVKMYRSKNNPRELQSLILKWRSSSQAMLYELQTALSTDSQKLSITQLIDNFGLDDQLLHYNRSEEDFTDA